MREALFDPRRLRRRREHREPAEHHVVDATSITLTVPQARSSSAPSAG